MSGSRRKPRQSFVELSCQLLQARDSSLLWIHIRVISVIVLKRVVVSRPMSRNLWVSYIKCTTTLDYFVNFCLAGLLIINPTVAMRKSFVLIATIEAIFHFDFWRDSCPKLPSGQILHAFLDGYVSMWSL
jgi:hypothetical protein